MAVLIGAAWPDNDASGPVQSVRQIVARFASDARFELFARSGAPGEPPEVAHRTRIAHPWGGITYLDVDRFGARDLRSVLVASRCDRIWLNSVWDREFTLPTLAWRRFGSALPTPALLSTRGELSVGALKLHARRKAAMRTFLKASGMLSEIWFHATTSDEARDVARSFPDHPILVAGNLRGMPPQEPDVPAQDGCLRLLYLGRISPVKGLHNALAALSRVTVPTRFTVCGPVHDASYFKKCIELLGALPKSIEVDFAGPVSNAEAAGRYAAADLFLNPSASENFGHTIFESLAAGTPVLTGMATPWSGLEGDRAGFNVSSEDHAAIAGVIERFADMSAADRASWRQAARERAQRQADDQATFEAWREWLTGDLSRPAREPNCQS